MLDEVIKIKFGFGHVNFDDMFMRLSSTDIQQAIEIRI